MSGEPRDEHIAVYLRFREVFGDPSKRSRDSGRRERRRDREPTSVPFGAGRDPHGVGDVLDALTARLGWESPLAQSELIASWPQLVGTDVAEHSTPAGVEDGVLTVRCDSTAWATQLRLMRTQITTNIAQRFPAAGISSIRFEGPNAPSWKRGPRSVSGRGPRDTYG